MMLYKIGFSLKEFNEISGGESEEKEIENLLQGKGFEYKKVNIGDVLKETIPLCLNAVYKNPSAMRIDAPRAFNCSSLISYLYTQTGVWMPSLSIDKYVFGTPISKESLKFGDLIFSNTSNGKIRYETVEWLPGTKVPEGVDHVALFIDEEKIMHATKRVGGVVIEKMDEKNIGKIVGFRRVADIKEKRFVVSIPDSRDDLRAKENLITELAAVADEMKICYNKRVKLRV